MKNESNTDYGGKTEDLIEYICAKTFLSDFTVRSPKYTKTKGREKEIADILIPFNNTLIAFQVKTKFEAKTIHDRSEVELDRIERKVGETVRQFKAIEEAFRNDKIDNQISWENNSARLLGRDVAKNTDKNTLHNIMNILSIELNAEISDLVIEMMKRKLHEFEYNEYYSLVNSFYVGILDITKNDYDDTFKGK